LVGVFSSFCEHEGEVGGYRVPEEVIHLEEVELVDFVAMGCKCITEKLKESNSSKLNQTHLNPLELEEKKEIVIFCRQTSAGL
jgi:hypothetical protein